MDELGGVIAVALVMTGVVAALVAALRWKQDRDDRLVARITAVKRTASPGRGHEMLSLHSLETGAPELLDFGSQAEVNAAPEK